MKKLPLLVLAAFLTLPLAATAAPPPPPEAQELRSVQMEMQQLRAKMSAEQSKLEALRAEILADREKMKGLQAHARDLRERMHAARRRGAGPVGQPTPPSEEPVTP
jgi:septal ring factor EnvC (AmiA/AmiB activator)